MSLGAMLLKFFEKDEVVAAEGHRVLSSVTGSTEPCADFPSQKENIAKY